MSEILICVPTYNRNKSLIDCLVSIEKLKNNNFFKIKVLVMDNSITNDSFKIIKKFKKKQILKIYQSHEKKKRDCTCKK
jgi:glycosyltransferase involved in cell wall biosynthesis